MSGSAGLLNKKKLFTSSGAQRWAEREMGNTNKNTATLTFNSIMFTNAPPGSSVISDFSLLHRYHDNIYSASETV